MLTPTIIVILLVSPLIVSFLINAIAKETKINPSLTAVIGVTLVFCFTGVGHFLKTEPMAQMMPPWLPARIPLVYVTGILELAVAFAVLFPRIRSKVGWCLIAMLIMFLPVNIYAAINQVGMGGHQWGPVYLLIRIPLQTLLIAWIWWFVVRRPTAQIRDDDSRTTSA